MKSHPDRMPTEKEVLANAAPLKQRDREKHRDFFARQNAKKPQCHRRDPFGYAQDPLATT
jgi:hypothetical protein